MSNFILGYKMMAEDLLKIVGADHKKYKSVFSLGFGVWIYTETPKWWTTSGKSDKLPTEYAEAVLRAKKQ